MRTASQKSIQHTAQWLRASWWGQALFVVLMALVMFGPVTNLLIWTVTERWYFPHALPVSWGFKYWRYVFDPVNGAFGALFSSLIVACSAVLMATLVAIPVGYALARRNLPARAVIMLLFLLPQAFPELPIYINIARIFYRLGLNGTYLGVIIVHAVHGLVFSVWIIVAAFSNIDALQERAALNLGASPLKAFFTVSLPQAMGGIIASAIFVFLESLDEFTGSFFVGAPDVTTLPLLLYNASMEGNYQVASISALILLIPSVAFMLVVERFMRPEMVAKIGQ
ncbi:ABC transporter permease subunit [Celerinatantimonas yamalensis]|uniref:ABC transporter permease subunit n=2 Tax=Celerinatantimonas yamalensis TaxID=559956 RepID=A0ABW9G2F2_9GAMM